MRDRSHCGSNVSNVFLAMDVLVEKSLHFVKHLQLSVDHNLLAFKIAFILIGIGFLYYWFGLRLFQVLRNYGIPHPKPIPFFGSLIPYLRMGGVRFQQQCVTEYGNFYGYYIGSRPSIALNDPKLVEQVMVKDFSMFHNRGNFLLATEKPMDSALFSVDYKKWKRIRSVVSPTFSVAKLKEMLPLVQISTDTCGEIISDACKKGKKIDIFRSFGRLAMEVILSVGFGLENEFQKKGDNVLMKESMKFFHINPMVFFLELLPVPRFVKTWMKDRLCPLNPRFFVKLLKPILESRIKGLTADGSVYEEIQKLVFLDAVYNESLRMYPPAYQTTRIVQKECMIGDHLVPKGICAVIPIYGIHHTEEFWENHDRFDPDRFMPGRKSSINSYAFLPFGAGPRNCVGMRFAIVEAKLAIIRLIKRFKFERSPETEIPLQLQFGVTISPKNGIYLKITERN